MELVKIFKHNLFYFQYTENIVDIFSNVQIKVFYVLIDDKIEKKVQEKQVTFDEQPIFCLMTMLGMKPWLQQRQVKILPLCSPGVGPFYCQGWGRLRTYHIYSNKCPGALQFKGQK